MKKKKYIKNKIRKIMSKNEYIMNSRSNKVKITF